MKITTRQRPSKAPMVQVHKIGMLTNRKKQVDVTEFGQKRRKWARGVAVRAHFLRIFGSTQQLRLLATSG